MSRRHVGFVVALGVFAAAGCGAEQMPAANQDMSTGKISGDWPHGNATLRVAYGKRWVVGGEARVNSSGEFQVPSSARVVVAYIDANHNGKFDRFVEPSGDCQLTEREWTCSILLQRTTLHRAIILRDDRHNDKTYVFWEDFRPDGTWLNDSHLCVQDRCTTFEPGPFLSRSSAQVQEFSICGDEGFSPLDADIRAPERRSTVHITQPAKFEVSMNTEPSIPAGPVGEELRLSMKAPPVDRVLIWGGSVTRGGEIKHMYWSSEDVDIPIANDGKGMEARIPVSKIQLCQRDPDCEIVVQLLKYWSPPGAPIVSATEYRSTVNVRGRP